jgi:hypothetical protein
MDRRVFLKSSAALSAAALPGGIPLARAVVEFGSWEMNWMAYNYAHDLLPPGASRGAVGFFMYPRCETAEGRLDSLDPDNFRYQITAKELV